MSVKKAIIPLGGLATRFLPASKAVPKGMFPVVDKPILQYIIEELSEAGVTDILLLVGRNNEAILNHFDKFPELNENLTRDGKFALLEKAEKPVHLARILYKRMYDPRGVADVVMNARTFIGNDPFFMVYGDELFYNENSSSIKQMIDVYNQTQKAVVGCYSVDPKDVYKYGIMAIDNVDGILNITHMVEKPKVEEAPSTLSAVGKYILNPDVFEVIEEVSKNFNKEKNFTEALNILAGQGKVVACDLKGERYDTGSKLGYLLANVAYGLKDKEICEELKNNLITMLEGK